MGSEAKQLHILQHSLGVDQHGRGRQYRNHFCTGKGSVDHPICEDLVDLGLMMRRSIPMYGGDDVYFVTDQGRRWMLDNSPQPPKLTRSQARYQRYLDADSGLSFWEWLKYDREPERVYVPTPADIENTEEPNDG